MYGKRADQRMSPYRVVGGVTLTKKSHACLVIGPLHHAVETIHVTFFIRLTAVP
jgi:hypothetical protein